MKWNFFYDEDDQKPYNSIQDWYEDIRHLIIPFIVMIVIGIAIYIFFKYFYS